MFKPTGDATALNEWAYKDTGYEVTFTHPIHGAVTYDATSANRGGTMIAVMPNAPATKTFEAAVMAAFGEAGDALTAAAYFEWKG